MTMTGKQAYVLANLDRVVTRPYRVLTPDTRTRFDLDGWECTPQITSLVVKKRVRRLPDGRVARSQVQEANDRKKGMPSGEENDSPTAGTKREAAAS